MKTNASIKIKANAINEDNKINKMKRITALNN
jgi:hypothetical protein